MPNKEEIKRANQSRLYKENKLINYNLLKFINLVPFENYLLGNEICI